MITVAMFCRRPPPPELIGRCVRRGPAPAHLVAVAAEMLVPEPDPVHRVHTIRSGRHTGTG
ncbi:MAG: hypothetical protein HOQ36_03140 [Nocardia sp.]|nr:hypothetical protein [Nocardia sp.]